MSRYIDAERIDFRLIRPKYITTGEECMFLNIKNLIDRQPIADVAPVVHGKWIHKGEEIFCSECNFRFYPVMFKYCPGCGARMDGEVN